jgi:hypothetical protein
MSRGVLTWRDRALLHNALRDVEEIAFEVMENVEARRINFRTKVETTSSGEARMLLDCEVPLYLNISEALLLIRRLIQLVLEMDEKEKIRELEKLWNSEEKKEEVKK